VAGAIAGERLRGVARAATNPLAQARQLGRQGGELVAELVDLLLLEKYELSGLGWPRQPICFWNRGRRRADHRRSLPEIQPGIKLLSRVQGRGQCSQFEPSYSLNGYEKSVPTCSLFSRMSVGNFTREDSNKIEVRFSKNSRYTCRYLNQDLALVSTIRS
jgi:hypothetical protein